MIKNEGRSDIVSEFLVEIRLEFINDCTELQITFCMPPLISLRFGSILKTCHF